jgi:hypothetical protein
MPAYIQQSLNMTDLSTADVKELARILLSIRTDLSSLATQFNQLRTDYNANATIATDTTATAITLTTLA